MPNENQSASGNQTSMNYATVTAAFTPISAGFKSKTFSSDIFSSEEEFLGEPQPFKERAKPFVSNDGNVVQWIDIFSTAGKRDVTIFDGDALDFLLSWFYSNPQPLFNLGITYLRNDQIQTQVRTQMHLGCKVLNTPMRVLSNEIAVVKFTLGYGKLIPQDSEGSLVS